jgi:hypothetical protein
MYPLGYVSPSYSAVQDFGDTYLRYMSPSVDSLTYVSYF